MFKMSPAVYFGPFNVMSLKGCVRKKNGTGGRSIGKRDYISLRNIIVNGLLSLNGSNIIPASTGGEVCLGDNSLSNSGLACNSPSHFGSLGRAKCNPIFYFEWYPHQSCFNTPQEFGVS